MDRLKIQLLPVVPAACALAPSLLVYFGLCAFPGTWDPVAACFKLCAVYTNMHPSLLLGGVYIKSDELCLVVPMFVSV